MNITEIAKLAGVSRATVSRYLNQGYVSEEKSAKIQKVIKETGYVPSMYAQTLRTQKSNLIGVIIPKISSEAVSRMVEGISQKLADTGYNIVLGNTDNDVEKEYRFLEIFKKNRVDGILFIATMMTAQHYRLLKQIDVPVVVLGQEVDQYCCVFHDDFGAAYQLTERLLDKGVKKPAFIGVTEQDKSAGLERLRGFQIALETAGIKVDEKAVVKGSFELEFGYQAMAEIYQYQPETDGVFCATDSLAVGAMEFLKDAGILIKDKIFLGGIGDTRFSRLVTPKLTSVHYYYESSGMEAAKMLLDMLEENSQIIKKMKLGFEVKERETL